MSLFRKLFHIFEKNNAHKHLLEEYSRLNEIAILLINSLKVMRQIQKKIVEVQLERTGYTKQPTGAIALKKTEFVEEELIKKLKMLAETSEKRFLQVSEEIQTREPMSREEKGELETIIKFLEKLKQCLPDITQLQNIPEKEKLRVVETALREITNLSKEFYNLEQMEAALARKVEENEISPLLQNVYMQPQHIPQDPNILVYPVTENQLLLLEKESKRINACQDPNYRIEWRYWWRETQIPEADKRTALKDPHINVTIKLFGRPKKDIHLLLKAA